MMKIFTRMLIAKKIRYPCAISLRTSLSETFLKPNALQLNLCFLAVIISSGVRIRAH